MISKQVNKAKPKRQKEFRYNTKNMYRESNSVFQTKIKKIKKHTTKKIKTLKDNNSKNKITIEIQKEYYTCSTRIHKSLLNDDQEEKDTIQIEEFENTI